MSTEMLSPEERQTLREMALREFFKRGLDGCNEFAKILPELFWVEVEEIAQEFEIHLKATTTDTTPGTTYNTYDDGYSTNVDVSVFGNTTTETIFDDLSTSETVSSATTEETTPSSDDVYNLESTETTTTNYETSTNK